MFNSVIILITYPAQMTWIETYFPHTLFDFEIENDTPGAGTIVGVVALFARAEEYAMYCLAGHAEGHHAF